jgi:hypothetical protein
LSKRLAAVASLLAVSMLGTPSSATAQSAPPVAANAFITYLGLDWAWASPCRMSGDTCDGSYSFVDGFRFATATEWANRPAAADFLDPLGNYAGDGGQMRCATAWFSAYYGHCDYNDGVIGYFGSGPDLYVNDSPLRDTWLVRGESTPEDVVPEPATMSLLATGLVGLAVKRRRKPK